MTDTAVFVELPDGRTVQAGWVRHSTTPGRRLPSINFEYEPSYLSDAGAYPLSPDLPLVQGFMAGPLNRPVFAALSDAQPDAWGRKLLQADNRRQPRGPGTRWQPLTEVEFLLRVPDETRQGALRFADRPGTPYLAPARQEIPSLVDLDELVVAAEQFERGEDIDGALRVLLPAGTTQGGARPKTTVLDSAGHLALAKLPHPDDRWDVQAWEAATLDLSRRAGITVPAFELRRISEQKSVLVIRRFDRKPDGGRVGYLSLKNLLLADADDTIDYASLAPELAAHSGRPAADAEELYRRVALTLLVNNVDDHRKNHGVLRTARGWNLSPAFDVNPHPFTSNVNSTPVNAYDDEYDRDIRLLAASHADFRLNSERATAIVHEVEAATSEWADVALEHGIARDSMTLMAKAFENVNRDRARDLTLPDQPLTIDLSDGQARAARPTGSVWVKPHIADGQPVAGYWRKQPWRG